MTTLTPAAQAIIQALSAPGLDDAQRAALAAALTTVMTTPVPPEKQGRVRRPAEKKAQRKADSVRLGKESVAALPLPATGERYVYDTECPQLAVRLRPGGRTYVCILWDNKRRRAVKATLGKIEKLTPEQARTKAQAMVADVAAGLDVRRPAVEGVTVAELIDKWHAEKAHSVRTADELKTKALHYLGRLAHRRAADVSREDVGTIHHHIATEARKRVRKKVSDALQWVEIGEPGLPATADKWRATMNAVFAWGMSKGLVADNPAAGIDAAFDTKRAQRSQYLRGDALLEFWKAMEQDHDADTRDVFKLLLYTGQRRGNVLCMRWADVDIDHGVWSLSAADTKQRKAQSTPLTAQARAILARRYQDAASEWVFPATRATVGADGELRLGPMNEVRLRDAWTRVCKAAGISDTRIHDLRHTAGSWLAKLGANEAIRQKALGHQTPAMAARYSHLELDPVAAAMQGMSDAITAAATRQPGAVRALKVAKS